jgi:hypothetical protein
VRAAEVTKKCFEHEVVFMLFADLVVYVHDGREYDRNDNEQFDD